MRNYDHATVSRGTAVHSSNDRNGGENAVAMQKMGDKCFQVGQNFSENKIRPTHMMEISLHVGMQYF